MKKACWFVVFIFVHVALLAQSYNVQQKQTTGLDRTKLVYGGQVGFGFGSNDYWSFYLSPQIGYRLTGRLIAGAGVSYSYATEKYHWAGLIDEVKEKRNQFGINLYADYYLSKRFFVTVKPELFYQRYTLDYTEEQEKYRIKKNRFVPAALVGIGISLKPVILSLNYDIIQNDYTPYGDSVFLGIGFSF